MNEDARHQEHPFFRIKICTNKRYKEKKVAIKEAKKMYHSIGTTRVSDTALEVQISKRKKERDINA